MKEPNLTILIPTYNRREQLIELLKSIEKQGHFDEYKVVISDNHSNYDVQESVNRNFSVEFKNIITVHSWGFNTGMATNISVPFLLIKTEWCWMIGDDDSLIQGAVDIVLKQINEYRDVLAIKNTLSGFLPHEETSLSSIPEFIDYYSKEERGGEMMYLSMVYNLNNLRPYISKVTEYSYSYLSFLLPILFGLKDGLKFKLSSNQIIKYRNDASDNWAKVRALKVALGIRTIMDINFDIPDKQLKALHKVFMREIKVGFCMQSIINIPSKYYRNLLWSNLKPLFKVSSTWYNLIICRIVLSIFNLLNINLLSSALKVREFLHHS